MKRPRRATIEEPFRVEDRILSQTDAKLGTVILRSFLDSEGVEEFWVAADGQEPTIHVLESQAREAFNRAVAALTPEEVEFFDASVLDDDELITAHSEQRTAARKARTPEDREQAAEILAAVYDEMKVRGIGPFDSWSVPEPSRPEPRPAILDSKSNKGTVVATKDDGVTAGAHDAQEGKPNALLTAEDAVERLAAEHGEDWVEGYLQGYATFDQHHAKKRREAAAQGETVWVIRGRHPEDIGGVGGENDIVGSFDTQAEADAKRSELQSAGYTDLRVEPSFVATKKAADDEYVSEPGTPEDREALRMLMENMLTDGLNEEDYLTAVEWYSEWYQGDEELNALLLQLDEEADPEWFDRSWGYDPERVEDDLIIHKNADGTFGVSRVNDDGIYEQVASFDTKEEADEHRSSLRQASASSPKVLEWTQTAEAMLDDGFIPEEYFEMVQIATDEDNIAREPEVAELLRRLDDAAAEHGYLDFEDTPGYVDASKKIALIDKDDPEANLVDITDPKDTVESDEDDIQDAVDDDYDATGSPIEETWVAFVTAIDELEVPHAAPYQLIYAGPDKEEAKRQLGTALRGAATSWQREGDIDEWEDARDQLEGSDGEVSIEFGGTRWSIERRENELATTASKLAVNYPRTGEKCPNCGAEDWEAAIVRDVACGSCGETFDVQGGELKTSKYNLADRKLQMIRDRKDAQLTVARLAQHKRAAPYFTEGERYEVRVPPGGARQPKLLITESNEYGSWSFRDVPLNEGDIVTYVGSRREPGTGSVHVDIFRTADGEEGAFEPNSWGGANPAYFTSIEREPAPEPLDTLEWTEETGVLQASPDETYDLLVEMTDPIAVEAGEFDFIEQFEEYDEEPYMWVILKDQEIPVAGGWAGRPQDGQAYAENAYRSLGTTASKTDGIPTDADVTLSDGREVYVDRVAGGTVYFVDYAVDEDSYLESEMSVEDFKAQMTASKTADVEIPPTTVVMTEEDHDPDTGVVIPFGAEVQVDVDEGDYLYGVYDGQEVAIDPKKVEVKGASKTAASGKFNIRVENQGDLPIGDPLRGWAGLDEEPWFWVIEHGSGRYPDIVATGTGVTEEAARADAERALEEVKGDFLAEEGEAQTQLALGKKQASSFDPRSILTDIDRSEWREWAENEGVPWQTLQKAVIEFVMGRAESNIDAALRADVAVNDMAAQGGDAMDIQYEVSDLLEEEGIDRNDTWDTLRDEWAEVMRGLRRGGKKRAASTPMECLECGNKFKKNIGPNTTEVKCPKCGGYDTEPAFLANKHAGDTYKSEERFLDFCDALGLDERSREAREAWAEARQSDEKFQEVYRRYRQAKTDIMSMDAGELRDELARLHSSLFVPEENKDRVREVAQRLSDLTGLPFQQVIEVAREDAGVERGWGDDEAPANWKIPETGQYERARAATKWYEDPVNVERLAMHITSNYNTNNGQTITELYREPHRFQAEWERMDNNDV